MEENTYKIRKDRIKNIAIIFLVVMLVLTFFSNSILNRSLPEVATETVAYDTITERVRGTGTVEADDPYKVVVKDSRTIESVAVKEGDMVMKDQVLFYLEDKESTELKEKEEAVKTKEDELSKQILEYMTSILSVDISNTAYQNIENDNIAGMAAYQAQIEASRQKVQNAQNTVDSLNRQILVAGMESEDDIDRETELAIATANMNAASKRMSDAQAQISSAEATIKALNDKVAGEDTNGNGTIDPDEKGKALEVAALKTKEDYNAFKTGTDAYDTKQIALVEALVEATKSDTTTNPGNIPPFKEADYFDGDKFPKSPDSLLQIDQLITEIESKNGVDVTELKNKNKAVRDLYEKGIQVRNAKETAEKDLSDYNTAKATLSSAQNTLKNATNEYNSFQSKVNSLTNEGSENAGENKELQNSLKVSLEDANAALKAAQAEQEQLLKDISGELSLSSKNDDIADAEEELAELRAELEELQAEATDASILSPVEGTVLSVSKTAGESTTPEEEVALIQVTGKGMSCSFSVTNEQAAKVKVGDVAELQNAWYYTDVMVTLSKIKPDPENPGKRKLLEFDIEGSIQNGESLTLSVGGNSADYDLVVPNSAIREDKNGKFILIIEEKSTPFGNRYKAKRVDAEVVASDETKSAISADLQGYEYVITTSNQPVESGDQVRLAGY